MTSQLEFYGIIDELVNRKHWCVTLQSWDSVMAANDPGRLMRSTTERLEGYERWTGAEFRRFLDGGPRRLTASADPSRQPHAEIVPGPAGCVFVRMLPSCSRPLLAAAYRRDSITVVP